MSICCNRMFHAFQIYVAYISSGCYKSRSGVAYVTMAIDVCCKCMFEMFQLFEAYVASVLLDVAYVLVAMHVCCKCFI